MKFKLLIATTLLLVTGTGSAIELDCKEMNFPGKLNFCTLQQFINPNSHLTTNPTGTEADNSGSGTQVDNSGSGTEADNTGSGTGKTADGSGSGITVDGGGSGTKFGMEVDPNG